MTSSKEYNKRYRENNKEYISKWNREYNDKIYFGGFREAVLERDNWECQECGMNQEQHIVIFGTSLSVHHIDLNEKNNVMENLITLCKRDHGKIHGNLTTFHEGSKGKHWKLGEEILKKREGQTHGFKKGHEVSNELKEIIRKRMKGKTYEEIYGIEKGRELREKQRGKIPWNKGRRNKQ